MTDCSLLLNLTFISRSDPVMCNNVSNDILSLTFVNDYAHIVYILSVDFKVRKSCVEFLLQ